MALRTSLFIDLAGNMAARAHQLLGGLQRLGAKGSHSMTVLNRTIQATGRGLDRWATATRQCSPGQRESAQSSRSVTFR